MKRERESDMSFSQMAICVVFLHELNKFLKPVLFTCITHYVAKTWAITLGEKKKQEIKTKKLFGLGLMSSENEEKIDPRMKKGRNGNKHMRQRASFP